MSEETPVLGLETARDENSRWDDGIAPLGALAAADLAESLERARWLVDHPARMPRSLWLKAETWLADLVAEQEDRTRREAGLAS